MCLFSAAFQCVDGWMVPYLKNRLLGSVRDTDALLDFGIVSMPFSLHMQACSRRTRLFSGAIMCSTDLNTLEASKH